MCVGGIAFSIFVLERAVRACVCCVSVCVCVQRVFVYVCARDSLCDCTVCVCVNVWPCALCLCVFVV